MDYLRDKFDLAMTAIQQILLAVGGPIATPVTYVTWDTATASNVTFSGGNLVTTSAGGSTDHGAHVASASGKTSGKYYFEIFFNTAAGGGDTGLGIGTPTSTYAGMGNNATVGAFVFQSGATYSNGSRTGIAIGVFLNGLTFSVAVDLDNREIWFRNSSSGLWNASGTANPATNTGGINIPAGTMVPFVTFNVSGNVWTANFGAAAFSGAMPSGFTAGWPA